MTQWQYLTARLDPTCRFLTDYREDGGKWNHLDVLGAEGWKLVEIVPFGESWHGFFIRPKVESAAPLLEPAAVEGE